MEYDDKFQKKIYICQSNDKIDKTEEKNISDIQYFPNSKEHKNLEQSNSYNMSGQSPFSENNQNNSKPNGIEEKKILLFSLSYEQIQNLCYYDPQKDCHCKEHDGENYLFFKDCLKDLCYFCKDEHESHEIVDFNKEKMVIKNVNQIKEKLKRTENEAYLVIKKFENCIEYMKIMIEKLKLDIKIKNDLVYNYKFSNRNFKILNYLKLIKNNYSIFDDLNTLMEKKNDIINKIKEPISQFFINRDNGVNSISINNNFLCGEASQKKDIPSYFPNKIVKNNLNKKNNNEVIINLEYKTDKKPLIRILGKDFVNKNLNKIKIIYNHKENKATDWIINENKNKIINIKLKVIDEIFSIKNMFYDCTSLTRIQGLEKLKVSHLTDMSNIFYNCTSLIDLRDISKWDTSNVVDMSGMFYNCSSLQFLPDISGWKIGKITNMNSMFYNCNSLKTLPDISKWKTSKLINMSYMFFNCYSLKILPEIYKWDISNVKYLNHSFYRCPSLNLESINISKWKIPKDANIDCMFSECSALLENLKNFNFYDIINFVLKRPETVSEHPKIGSLSCNE